MKMTDTNESKGGTTVKYRNYVIRHDPPPIPSRQFDWSYCHEDFDGAIDSKDHRYGFASTREAAIAEIDEIYAESEH